MFTSLPWGGWGGWAGGWGGWGWGGESGWWGSRAGHKRGGRFIQKRRRHVPPFGNGTRGVPGVPVSPHTGGCVWSKWCVLSDRAGPTGWVSAGPQKERGGPSFFGLEENLACELTLSNKTPTPRIFQPSRDTLARLPSTPFHPSKVGQTPGRNMVWAACARSGRGPAVEALASKAACVVIVRVISFALSSLPPVAGAPGWLSPARRRFR